MAPKLAEWTLSQVVSVEAKNQTLVYEYTGSMTNTGRDFNGSSTVRFDFASTKTTRGWYGLGEQRVEFRLLPLAALEACLGVSEPASARGARYQGVATSTPEQLEGCVSEG